MRLVLAILIFIYFYVSCETSNTPLTLSPLTSQNDQQNNAELNPKISQNYSDSEKTLEKSEINQVTPFKLTGLGFEDLHLLCSIIHIGKTDPNRFFVWLVGGHVVHGGTKVDPHTKSRGLFIGQKTPDGQSILLPTDDLHLFTEGTPLPVDSFRIDAKFQEFLFTFPNFPFSISSISSLPSQLLNWISVGRNSQYQSGMIEGRAIPPEVNFVRKPVGVWFFRIFSRIRENFGQLQLVSVLHFNSSIFTPQDHVFSTVLLDDSTQTVIPYSYVNDLHLETNTATGGTLHIVLSIPHEVKELPLSTRAIVMVDLFTLYSDRLDLEETDRTTHHLWYHLFGNELLTLIISAILLILYDQTFRHIPNSQSDRSWLMTLISSIVTSIVGCYITFNIMNRPEDTKFHEMVWDDHIVSRASLCFFMAYLFLDLFIGSYQYKSQITIVTGYIHHVVYTGLSFFLLVEKMSNVLALFFVLEIPTVVLAVGHLFKRFRQDLGFGVIFFVTRILYHLWLMFVLWPSITGVGKMGVFVLGFFLWGLHWHWFLSWFKGERKRRLLKKKKT